MTLAALGLTTGCTGIRGVPETLPDSNVVGVYRVHARDAAGKERRFRLLLFAELPDRLHGEVLSPLGSTEMIVDGGNGRLAVTLVDEGVAFTGIARRADMQRILGVSMTLGELVRGLLTGASPADGSQRVERDASTAVGLPKRIRIEADGGGLLLELKRFRPMRFPAAGLATGSPPDGVEIRPLDELGS